jgi:hypothetical protein
MLADIGNALGKYALRDPGHGQQKMIAKAVAAFRCTHTIPFGHEQPDLSTDAKK